MRKQKGGGKRPLGGGVSGAVCPVLAQVSKLVRLIVPPTGHNACIDWPCSLLCLPRPGHRHTCICPDGTPTATTPDGELQCQCPSGYQLHNKTCVKTGETAAELCWRPAV